MFHTTKELESQMTKFAEQTAETHAAEINKLKQEHADELRKMSHEKEDEIRASEIDNQQALNNKTHELAIATNETARVRAELDSRLLLQEDIHLDYEVMIDNKYKAKEEALTIAYEAKVNALETTYKAKEEALKEKRSEILDAARAQGNAEATRIIADAQEKADEIRRSAYLPTLTAIVDAWKKGTDLAGITALLETFGSNYPGFPDVTTNTTSTSSSK